MSEPSDNNASDSLSPTQGKPRREAPEQTIRYAASKTEGGPSSGPSKTTPGKRREQVRHAQRTHRQRTQNYIKALEAEVIRLRGSEGDLMQQNKKLQNQVDTLLSSLTQANVPLPSGFKAPARRTQAPEPNFDMPTTISYKTDGLQHPRLHVDWPASFAGLPFGAPREGSVSPHEQFAREPSMSNLKPLPNLSLSSLSFGPAHGKPPLLTAQDSIDTAEVAIDFVLALEHPCMTHLPHPANPPSEDPSNHALLMSTPLMSRSSRPPQPDSSWTANSSVLQQLLNLSSSINLDGEITPVEAWHRLRQHPGFLNLDKSSIERIKGDLSTIVRCCG
ncbi:MAG: hypothetical protein Q9218_003081 [Villophora microphyllina]